MVSKAAVIALVAIFAIPILLGYAFNLTEETKTEYKPEGDSVNVTPLLQTDSAYTAANAEINALNTDFEHDSMPYHPVYTKITTTNTSYQMDQRKVVLTPGGVVYWRLSDIDGLLYIFAGNNSGVRLDYNDRTGTGLIFSYQNIQTIMYDSSDQKMDYSYRYGASGSIASTTVTDIYNYVVLINENNFNATIYYDIKSPTGSKYVDFAGGFYCDNMGSGTTLNLPERTKSVLITIDLNSITDSSYTFKLSGGQLTMLFTKTTTNGVVNWSVKKTAPDAEEIIEDNLYYNQSSSSNTYQIYLNIENLSSYDDPYMPGRTLYVNTSHVELRYVGNWPTAIGSANYYQRYVYDYTNNDSLASDQFNKLTMRNEPASSTGRSPLMRIDGALYSAFAYGIITDASYSPADFKINPTTTLSVNKAGISLEFGGNTYTVDSSGNITLGTHKVSTNGMKLSSVPVAGGYENKINDVVVSTTADPSTIRFNGHWGASVSTVANTSSTYTTTEWHAGSFGWDGIDHNFLMIGLLTSVGVFIALGLYVRRTRSSLWPLLVVCGGAVMLFFIML